MFEVQHLLRHCIPTPISEGGRMLGGHARFEPSAVCIQERLGQQSLCASVYACEAKPKKLYVMGMTA